MTTKRVVNLGVLNVGVYTAFFFFLLLMDDQLVSGLDTRVFYNKRDRGLIHLEVERPESSFII